MGKFVLISDFLCRIKRSVDIEESEKYKLVTIKLKHKGVVLRQEKLGSEIKSKMFEIREGDFILSGIDARNGAFGIVPKELDGAVVTNDFWYFKIDESIVDKRFFLELTSTQWFDEICRKGSDGTTQRIRLQKNKFFNQEIFVPELHEQRKFIEVFRKLKSTNSVLSKEITHQQTLLKKLRQQILQEAIEGKLTADWRAAHPDVEPASALLARIKAEKEELIQAKKIRKQKPLPPIIDEEKPFDLPDGWVWNRLGELIYYSDNLNIQKEWHPQTTVNYVDIDSIDNSRYCIKSIKQKKVDELSSRARRVLEQGFIVYSTVRPYLKNIAFIEDELPNMIGSTGFVVFNPIIASKKFIFNYLISPKINEAFKETMIGFNSPSITNSQFENTIIPLPPLPEQHAIVAKVEKLLAICDQLEAQITQNQTYAEALMQAVLKEAFQHEKADVC